MPQTEETQPYRCIRCKRDDYDATHDLRTLFMSCLYAMEEMHDVPFEQTRCTVVGTDYDRVFYTLRVCKSCRADWMSAIQSWFNDVAGNTKSLGASIPVRINGATKMMTSEEYAAYRAHNRAHRMLESSRDRS